MFLSSFDPEIKTLYTISVLSNYASLLQGSLSQLDLLSNLSSAKFNCTDHFFTLDSGISNLISEKLIVLFNSYLALFILKYLHPLSLTS